jgi:hypothetical protein
MCYQSFSKRKERLKKPERDQPFAGGFQISNRLCVEEMTVFEPVKESEEI